MIPEVTQFSHWPDTPRKARVERLHHWMAKRFPSAKDVHDCHMFGRLVDDAMSEAAQTVTIRDERLSDHSAIASLHRTVFRGDGEARLIDALRSAGLVLVSLVAVREANVAGHVMFSALQLKVADRDVAAAALAPLAVSPGLQAKGYGSSLVKAGIEAVRAAGCEAIIVLGHPNYYRRFGFSADLTRNLIAPFRGPTFMGLELLPDVLAGREGSVTYPPAFRSLD